MPKQTRGYAHRVDIYAGIDQVWSALVDPSRLRRWCARSARVDARAGGEYSALAFAGHTREARIDVFQPPNRLRLIYLPWPELPPEHSVIVDDLLLEAKSAVGRREARTVLLLLGSGIPESSQWDALYALWRGGWERSLLRLKTLLEARRRVEAGAKRSSD